MEKIITKISKKYKSSKLTKKSVKFDDFIDVFEDKSNGWYLDWAYNLNNHTHSGFAVLHLLFSYFEGIHIFKEGIKSSASGNSQVHFKESFKKVFDGMIAHIPNDKIDDTLSKLYRAGRCGFFHLGMSRREIALDDRLPTIKIDLNASGDVTKIRIDRHSFMEQIKKDFRTYIANLRNPDKSYDQQRKKFAEVWNETQFIPIPDAILNSI